MLVDWEYTGDVFVLGNMDRFVSVLAGAGCCWLGAVLREKAGVLLTGLLDTIALDRLVALINDGSVSLESDIVSYHHVITGRVE